MSCVYQGKFWRKQIASLSFYRPRFNARTHVDIVHTNMDNLRFTGDFYAVRLSCFGKLNFTNCPFNVVVMLLKMAYQSLREMCATSGEYIKREIFVLLSTLSPSMTNGHAVSVTHDQTKCVLISHDCTQQSLSIMTTAVVTK